MANCVRILCRTPAAASARPHNTQHHSRPSTHLSAVASIAASPAVAITNKQKHQEPSVLSSHSDIEHQAFFPASSYSSISPTSSSDEDHLGTICYRQKSCSVKQPNGASYRFKVCETWQDGQLVALDVEKVQSLQHLLDCYALCDSSSLKSLRLEFCQLDSNDAIKLVEVASHVPELRELYLTGTKTGDEGVQVLVNHGHQWPRLQKLGLAHCGITDKGVAAVAEKAANWPELRLLDFRENSVSDGGMQAIAQYGGAWPQLQRLLLQRNRVGWEGVLAVAEAGGQWPHLKQLMLAYNRVGDVGADALAEHAPFWLEMEQLDLRHNKITSKGVISLAKQSGHWPLLKYLQLDHNHIGDEGAMALALYGGGWGKLAWLGLMDCAVGQKGITVLKQHMSRWPVADWAAVWNGAKRRLGYLEKAGLSCCPTSRCQRYLQQREIQALRREIEQLEKALPTGRQLCSMA
eukprot:jgi/Chrzof1/13737/Cz08g10070.t1